MRVENFYRADKACNLIYITLSFSCIYLLSTRRYLSLRMLVLFLKPAIHYSQTWRIGNETIFSPNKILFAKTGRICYYTPFVVCRQFSHEHICQWNFLKWKTTLCSSKRLTPRHKSCEQRVQWKTCSRNMANTHYTLFAVRHFFVISPLFCRCLRIVDGLYV